MSEKVHSAGSSTLIPEPANASLQARDVSLKDAEPVEPEIVPQSIRSRDFGFLPIPKRLRYDPQRGFNFTLLLNVIFAVASTFSVANLYYCQPILIELSESFEVSYTRVSNVPALTQAGYATGILFISPLGDLLRRRQLLLILQICCTTLSIGFACTNSFTVFETLSFITGIVTVTPQIMIPLVADLAPANRRASAISIVFSGLLLGVLIARVLGGIIAEYSSWRNVYWMSVGSQCIVLTTLYFVLPDWPDKQIGLSYWQILLSLLKFAVTEPVLIQSSLISLCSSAVFSNFWVTLTFLLGGPPYNYSTLIIGLFGVIGMLGVFTSPLLGRAVDNLNPWFGTLFGLIGLLVSLAVDMGLGIVSIGAVVVACFLLDVADSLQQVSNSTRNFAIDPSARARINSVYILFIFLGQVMGSSLGARVFLQYGQRASAGLSIAWICFALLVLLARGPYATTWLGWTGTWRGWRRQSDDAEADKTRDVGSAEETSSPVSQA